MNQTTNFTIGFNFLFLVAGGLILFAMVMGKRSKHPRQSNAGWWVGFVVLLVLASSFLSFMKYRVSSVTEERHVSRNNFSEFVLDIKGDLKSSIRDVKESIHESVKDLKEKLPAPAVPRTPPIPPRPGSSTTTAIVVADAAASRAPFSLIVSMKDYERRQKREDVEAELTNKAVAAVNQWIRDRMPNINNIMLYYVNSDWLKRHDVLPGEIEYTEEQVPTSSSGSTDMLYGGAMKLVLTSSIQEELINIGYKVEEAAIHEHTLMGQSVVFAWLIGLTVLAALIAIARKLMGY